MRIHNRKRSIKVLTMILCYLFFINMMQVSAKEMNEDNPILTAIPA